MRGGWAMIRPMHPTPRQATPDKDAIALLPAFERLGPDRITLVHTEAQARTAYVALTAAKVWGFCLLYTSPSPRDYAASRMPSSA